GDTLGDLLATGSIDPPSAARIVAEVAAAISGAHAAGLAHLCLRPDAIRWTAGGGVKVTGLGIDAALTGMTAEDPELADTRGLGELLYAALTGLWPGPDDSGLPPAPEADGWPRRPRQVRAGVPTTLDDITGRALALPGRDQQAAFDSPAELATALAAALPPQQVPMAATAQVHRPRLDSGRVGQSHAAGWPNAGGASHEGRPGRRGVGRVAAVGLLVLVVAVGAGAAAMHLLHKSHSGGRPGGKSSASSSPSAHAAIISPTSASGFDALNPGDTGDENTADAGNVLKAGSAGWATQQYYRSPYFGNLKAGTGLILDLGKPARVTSITVQFGSVPGANVQIKAGDSNTRSAANLATMTTVASMTDVSGSYTFVIQRPVSDRYLVIWFTKLPPMTQGGNKYMAQIFGVAIHGSS
ncbi:MAG TPA: serine/threonine protein kinase, partial [Streptosporangiaceae bacterium]|nr:serine/threonine protein kinase [Streptosporangiaceae bacterium]